MSRGIRGKARADGFAGPVAFVFSSGGGRAAAQVGMMQGLREAGVTPDLVLGSSFGSINAGAYAAAEPFDHAEVTERLRGLWERVDEDSVFSSPGASIARRLTVSRGNRATKEFRELLSSCVPDAALDTLPTPLFVSTTDLATGKARVIDQGPALDTVLASCAMPLFLNPVTIDDRLLIDGGFTRCAPLRVALERGAKSVVLLDAGASTVPESELPGLRWWEVAATAYDHLIRGQLGHDLDAVGRQIPVLTVTTDHGNVFDFSDPTGMYAAGLSAVREALPRLSEVQGAGLFGVPIGFEDFAPISDLVR